MTSKSGSNGLFPKSALQKILGSCPILVHPNLAMIIGVTNSICWQQLNYCINNDSNKNFFEGRKWVCNTYAQWREQLPFLAEVTIKKAFQEMKNLGIVLSRMEGRVKYYSIDYEALAKIQ